MRSSARDGRRVDHRRARAARRPGCGRAPIVRGVVESQPGPVEQHAPGQRVAVGAQARRRQADAGRRPASTCSPVMIWSRSTTPTAKPTRSNSPGSMAPGCSAISPPMSAQPACRHPSATPSTSCVDVVGVEPARPRCSRGRTAARRPGTRGRRRTWPPGRCRWCRSARRPGRPAPWCPRRRWTTPARAGGSAAASKPNSPPKPPMSPMTSGRNVERTLSLMRSTASSPAAMSTPAARRSRPWSAQPALPVASLAGSTTSAARHRSQARRDCGSVGLDADLEHGLAQARPAPPPGTRR